MITTTEYRQKLEKARAALALADVHYGYLPDSVEHLRTARDIVVDLLPHLYEAMAGNATRLR